MKRILVSAACVAVLALTFSSDLTACGDKSLSAGGIRWQRALAARFPASILLYAPATSRLDDASRELRLQRTLQQVGHRYEEVNDLAALESSAATGRYNLVLADAADAATLQQRFQSSHTRVVVVSVAYQLNKVEFETTKKQTRFLIKAPSGAAEYLKTIVNAVRAADKLRKS